MFALIPRALRRKKNQWQLRQQRRNLFLERLEDRRVLDASAQLGLDGVVTIEGTPNHDRIIGYVERDQLCFLINAANICYANNAVSEVRIYGLSGNDSIELKPSVRQRALLDGGPDHDQLIAGSGAASASGGAGNDHITGGPQADRLYGGLGDDVIQGGEGDDFISGGSGNDQLYGEKKPTPNDLPDVEALDPASALSLGEVLHSVAIVGTVQSVPAPIPTSNDVILGGDGHDRLFGQRGHDRLHGGEGNDGMSGGGGSDYMEGDAGNDVLHGDGASDVLFGGLGDDQLNGGAANDYLIGGSGHDRMSGDAGDDWMWGDATNQYPVGYTDPVRYTIAFANTNRGHDVMYGGDGSDIMLAGNGNDLARGDDGADVVIGGAGGDVLAGANGADVVLGDWRFRADEDPRAAGQLELLDARLTAVLLADVLDPVEPEPVPHPNFNDFIYGGPGNDILLGMLGHDYIAGDADVIPLAAVVLPSEDEGDGEEAAQGAVEPTTFAADQLMNIEPRTVPELRFNDVIIGGVGDDHLVGNQGHDRIFGNEGNDRMFGNAGHDWMEGDAGHDILSGGRQSDVMFGGPGDDLMQGGSGGDYLVGGSGHDQQRGGSGNDWLWGDATNEYPRGYTDPVKYSLVFMDTNRGHDVLDGQEGDDVLLAGNGDDAVIGGAGGDVILGGRGSDRVSGDGPNADGPEVGGADLILGDTIFRLADADPRTRDAVRVINSATEALLVGEAEAEALTPADAESTLVVAYDDTIVAGPGNDVVFGQRGDDLIQGNAGSDYVDGGSGDDQLDGGDDDDVLLGGAGVDLLFGRLGSDSLRGGAGMDVLFGGEGDDHLFGDDDVDVLVGDAGNDYFEGGAAVDIIVAAGDGPAFIDTVCDPTDEDIKLMDPWDILGCEEDEVGGVE